MKKVIIIFAIPLSYLFCMDFDAFMQKSLDMQRQLVKIKQEESKNNINIKSRYENPNLEMAGSKDEYSISLTQPFRLSSGSLKEYEQKSFAYLDASNIFDIAQLQKNLSFEYLRYSYLYKKMNLKKEELDINKKILNISKVKSNTGSISDIEYLESKISYKIANSEYKMSKIEYLNQYYLLLKLSNTKEEVDIHPEYSFTLIVTNNKNPELLKVEKKSELLGHEASLSKTKYFDIFSEYESENEAFRIGIDLPLRIFDNKSEEKQILKLKAKTKKLLATNLSLQNNIELKRLEEELISLDFLILDLESILELNSRLFDTYSQSYKISKTNFLKLQDIKNKVIRVKQEILSVNNKKESNIIKQNYLRGAYNE
ncbi:MAG: Unknown protein [uncultured Campylobacterales bacterium]|uniref:TolC family protein n=1 Tax=uncultured Campylobacterales bacterium TaxID=352960 RepID=A0A6S6SPQ7_9BACT|nr:MAG: Unknown protein [uncultured Campylobacterales bacterium]